MEHPRRDRRRNSILLYPLLSVSVAALLAITSCTPPSTVETLPYDQFVDQVERGQVEQVNLSADRSQAVVVTQAGSQFAVNLPADPDLIARLQRNNVDVAVLPPRQGVDLSLLGPLILLVGIALGSGLIWIWALIDCATQETPEGNTRLVWVLIILLANLPGALLYLLVRRPQRLTESDPP